MSPLLIKVCKDFATIWTTIDPIGNVALFAGLTALLTRKERHLTALRACIYATIILVVAMTAGQVILDAIGIHMHSLKVAGGIILFLFGVQMLFGKMDKAERSPEEGRDLAVFPLAVPAIAGPGAMMAVIEACGSRSARALSAVCDIARAAGSQKLIAGQVADLEAEFVPAFALLVLFTFGKEPRGFQMPWATGSFEIAGITRTIYASVIEWLDTALNPDLFLSGRVPVGVDFPAAAGAFGPAILERAIPSQRGHRHVPRRSPRGA